MEIMLKKEEVCRLILDHLESLGYIFPKNAKDPIYSVEDEFGSIHFCFELPIDKLLTKKRGC